MALDAGIYSQYMRRPRSVADFDQMAMAEEDQQAKREANQLAMMVQREGIAEQRRQREVDNQMMAALGQVPAQASPEDVAAVYRRFGKIDKAGSVLKDAAAVAKDRAQTAQAEAGTKKSEQERGQQAYRFLMTGLAQANNPAAARAYLTQGAPVLAGAVGMQAAQAAIQGVPDDPQAFEQWRRGMYATGVKEPEKLLPAFAVQDFGGFLQPRGIDPVTGQMTLVGKPMAKTPTPDALVSQATQMRGQNMTNDRAADANARAAEANRIAAEGNVVKTETDLRKEFADLPEVKRYKAALPAYNAVAEAAKRGTPQSDINLVYGLAKLYDPDSVVREGEYATIANSQAIPEWLKGMAQRIAGGGRLTPETKQQIMVEANGRIGSYQREYEGAQKTYTDIVTKRGGRPGSVFTPVGASRIVDLADMPGGDLDWNKRRK